MGKFVKPERLTFHFVCSHCIYYNRRTQRCNNIEYLDQKRGTFHNKCEKFVKCSDYYREI